ncbi:MFS transporter [bacterium]|nr:MFS transporter [bacterium]
MNILKPPCDEGVIYSSSAISPCLKSARPWILAATIVGSSMAFIDGTVVNVALPALQQNLNATATDLQWVVESYALFLAALLLVGGSLGDRFGRRLIFAIGVGLFALASAWCGAAPNIRTLIIARAVQGIGGALLVPGSLAIIGTSFSEEERGRAIGTWSGFSAITTAIGPVLGGWLIEHFSWRAAFFINLPLAAFILLLVFRYVPESKNRTGPAKLDWGGALVATLGLGSVVYGLIESSNAGWRNPMVLSSLVAGVFLLALFLFLETSVKNPMLPLELFRSKNFTGSNALTFFLYAGLGGSLFFFPLNLIQVQGYSATAAGAAFLPFTVILFFLSRWSGDLVKKYGARIPLIIGPTISALGFVLFAIPAVSSNYWTSFFPGVVVLGFGMAISIAPLTTTVMNSVNENQAGIASGINNAVSRTAGLLAVALFGAVMLAAFSHHLDKQLSGTAISKEVRVSLMEHRSKLAALKPPAKLETRAKLILHQAIQSSFVSAFRLIMIISAGLAIASAIVAWVTIGR